MAQARGKLLLNANGSNVVSMKTPELRRVGAHTESARDEPRELETLRSINAHLLRELEAYKQREADALRRADRDELTGLYNRRCMLELLEQAIEESSAHHLCVGVLFIDLNGFKAINDTYGHAAGDKILTTVASRMSARVRAGDIVCRYGGDEFVVVLPMIPDAGAMGRVADAIRERVSLPCWFNGNQLNLTAAIGEAMYPHDGDDARALLHRADQAMYRVKHGATRLFGLPSSAQPGMSRRRGDRTKTRSGGMQ